jgi:uncharacterized protein YndB with AHSA1/START domain
LAGLRADYSEGCGNDPVVVIPSGDNGRRDGENETSHVEFGPWKISSAPCPDPKALYVIASRTATMSYSIKHLFHITAPRTKVYDAIRSIDSISQWWTVGTSGSDAVGGTLAFRFGTMEGPQFRVMQLVPGALVEWKCTEGFDDRVGTTLTFKLDENEGTTRIRFDPTSGLRSAEHRRVACALRMASSGGGADRSVLASGEYDAVDAA